MAYPAGAGAGWRSPGGAGPAGVEPFPGRALAAAGRNIKPWRGGSNNALAIGGDATRTAAACCWATRTSPGTAAAAGHEAHLTIPANTTWPARRCKACPGSASVSPGSGLDLVDYLAHPVRAENPDNPECQYDGVARDHRRDGQPGSPGTTAASPATSTARGLIVDLGGETGRVAHVQRPLLSIRDANLRPHRSAQQWVATRPGRQTAARATSATQFHEFAADRHGDAFTAR